MPTDILQTLLFRVNDNWCYEGNKELVGFVSLVSDFQNCTILFQHLFAFQAMGTFDMLSNLQTEAGAANHLVQWNSGNTGCRLLSGTAQQIWNVLSGGPLSHFWWVVLNKISYVLM